MFQIPRTIYDQIRQHGEAAYPNECCGILLGVLTLEAKSVLQAIPTANTSPTPARHYEIAPKDLVHILREARATGRELLGFYHSHPDHQAQPSATDLAEAHWLGCSYLITAVIQGHAAATSSFHLAGITEENKHFEAQDILIAESI